MRLILIPAYYHIKAWKSNLRVWAAILLGMGICLKNGAQYLSAIKTMECSVQIFEPYIVIGSRIPFLMGILLGNLLLLSDAPFINTLSKYEIIRIGRIKWFWGQITYIFISSILYSIMMLAFLCMITLLYSEPSLENTWSDGMNLLAIKQPAFIIRKFAFSFAFPDMIESLTPLKAVGETLVFNSLYMFLIGCMILVVNLMMKSCLGWIMAALIHILGYISYANRGIGIPMKFSLLCCAAPTYHYIKNLEMSSWYAFTLLSILSIILIGAGRKFIPKAEFLD